MKITKCNFNGQKPLGFVVATDKFLSSWGRCRNGGISTFACAFYSHEEMTKIKDNFNNRGDFKRVRVVLSDWRPRGGEYDCCSIQYDSAPFIR